MFNRLLVPTDGSGPATAALELAIKIASASATVHLLYVSENGDGDRNGGDHLEASEQTGNAILAAARELATVAETPVVTKVQ